MALIQVLKKCILCRKELAPNEKALALLPCTVVEYGRRSHWWDKETPAKPVEDGHFRVNLRNAKKEKGLFHSECFKKWFEAYHNDPF